MTKLIIAVAICVVLAVCVFMWFRVRSASRRKAIERYAQEHNFSFLGSSLPATLKLEISSFRHAKAISTAFAGTGREKEFVFFDCVMPGDRTSYVQSVLAIRHLGGKYPAAQFDRQLQEERRGDWTLIYHPKRTWGLSEIDAHVSSL
ncbi:MAG TPA: hypothetical protein VF018_11620 [Acidobacteriaceae bacterium]